MLQRSIIVLVFLSTMTVNFIVTIDNTKEIIEKGGPQFSSLQTLLAKASQGKKEILASFLADLKFDYRHLYSARREIEGKIFKGYTLPNGTFIGKCTESFLWFTPVDSFVIATNDNKNYALCSCYCLLSHGQSLNFREVGLFAMRQEDCRQCSDFSTDRDNSCMLLVETFHIVEALADCNI